MNHDQGLTTPTCKEKEMEHARTHDREIKDAYGGRRRVSFATVGESLTDQSMALECDINRILAKYQKTGVIDHLNRFEGSYGDFLETPSDYQTAINQVMAADNAFADLPSSVRRRFGNNAGEFLLFVGNPENLDEMRSLGLLRNDEVLEHFDTPPKPVKKPPQGASETEA